MGSGLCTLTRLLASQLPAPSQNSGKDGAMSFAIMVGSNAAFSVVKEFFPDLGRAIAKKRNKAPHQPGEDKRACCVP